MKIRSLFTIAGLSLLAQSALGGAAVTVPVEVDLANRTAFGAQVSAKISDNDSEFIGCGTRIFDDGLGNSFAFGFCQAEDAAGDAVFCATQTAGLIQAMNALTAYGFITFSWREVAPDTFECIRVGFSTQSIYLPDKKVK